MPIRRSVILSIERGLKVEAIVARIKDSLRKAQQKIDDGEPGKAQKILEYEMWTLSNELATVDEAPPELLVWRGKLFDLHRSLLPQDDANRKAQELYEQAVERIDFLDYASAFTLLDEARNLAPTRVDIQLLFADAAEHLSKVEEALTAYRAILFLDPGPYYGHVSRIYFRHLLRLSRRMLIEERAEDALAYYADILLLNDEDGDDPVSVEEFLERRARRLDQTESQIMIDIFEYAKAHDLIDLAVAAIERAARLEPDNIGLANRAKGWKFLEKLRTLLDEANLEGAARLKADTPEEILDLEEVQAFTNHFEKGWRDEIRARTLLVRAEREYKRNSFESAKKLAARIIELFPGFSLIARAQEIVRLCSLELKVIDSIELLEALISQFKIERADQVFQTVMVLDGVTQTTRYAGLREFGPRIELELEAAGLWQEASDQLEKDEIEKALLLLHVLATEYKETTAGKMAIEWLNQNKPRAMRRSKFLKRTLENLAALLGEEIVIVSESGEIEITQEAWQDFYDQLETEKGEGDGNAVKVASVGIPLALALTMLLAFARASAWHGRAKFALVTDGPEVEKRQERLRVKLEEFEEHAMAGEVEAEEGEMPHHEELGEAETEAAEDVADAHQIGEMEHDPDSPDYEFHKPSVLYEWKHHEGRPPLDDTDPASAASDQSEAADPGALKPHGDPADLQAESDSDKSHPAPEVPSLSDSRSAASRSTKRRKKKKSKGRGKQKQVSSTPSASEKKHRIAASDASPEETLPLFESGVGVGRSKGVEDSTHGKGGGDIIAHEKDEVITVSFGDRRKDNRAIEARRKKARPSSRKRKGEKKVAPVRISSKSPESSSSKRAVKLDEGLISLHPDESIRLEPADEHDKIAGADKSGVWVQVGKYLIRTKGSSGKEGGKGSKGSTRRPRVWD